MTGRFEGKVALITGGAQGIGKAAALQFARKGAAVAILHLDEPEQSARAAEVVREMNATSADGVAIAVDVVDHGAVARAAAVVAERFGRLDIAVTCAGVLSHTPVVELTEAEWDRVIAVNLKGTYNVIHAVAPIMVAQASGKIVTIGSQQTITGRGRAAYLAAKSGVIGLTKAAARELGPSGINVNCVAPGPTDTEMMRSAPGIDEQYIASLPLKRLGQPQDIADAILFLASDQGAYFCGQMLSPNGGIAM